MSNSVSLDSDEEDFRVKSFGISNLPFDSRIKVEDRADAITIGKTQTIARDLAPDMPHPSDPALTTRRLTNGTPSVPALEAAESVLAADVASLQSLQTVLNSENPPEFGSFAFPNLGYETVCAALAQEGFRNDQLLKHAETIKKHENNINLLLDLNAELMQHKAADGTVEMSEKLKDILKQLKESGIDLWTSNETALTKENINEIKSLSNARVEKLRFEAQRIFAGEVTRITQEMGAMWDCVKNILRSIDRQISAANKIQGR